MAFYKIYYVLGKRKYLHFLGLLDIGYEVMLIAGDLYVTMAYYSEDELMEVR